MNVRVIGAGPAGSSAALTALGEGAPVELFEKSHFPRHKVCGEFLSPEVAGLLDGLGVWSACERQHPARLRSIFLSLGARSKSWKLAEPARGLSRHSMDRILLDTAVERGAVVYREQAIPEPFDVYAVGRKSQAPRGKRLFGFKAHFTGPSSDVMGLYFFGQSYVGVNSVEGGKTNVCGLAPERMLANFGFDIDAFLATNRALKDRLEPMTRQIDWLRTGPLVFGASMTPPNCYAAGDTACFIDPFTGSGMLGAISTGILAGAAAVRRTDFVEFARRAAGLVQGQQRVAGLLRTAIATGWAERCLPFIPGSILFHATRPRKL